jgi:hypothetical protein
MMINPEIRLQSNHTYPEQNQNLITLNKNTLSLCLRNGAVVKTLTINIAVAFDVLTALTVKNAIIWNVTPCSLVEISCLAYS